MAFGVLTTNSVEEALARAGDGTGNKGHEAAVAAIEMATVVAQLTRPSHAQDVSRWHARARTRATGRARRRCRFCISGTSAARDVDRAAETFFTLQWPNAEPPPDELRDVRLGAGAATRSQRLDDDRSADRRDDASAGGPSGWRCSTG